MSTAGVVWSCIPSRGSPLVTPSATVGSSVLGMWQPEHVSTASALVARSGANAD
jgi:hypothetical protein